MPNTREKLIELIASKVCDTYSEACEEWLPHDCGKCYANSCHIAEIADHLIANGVTIQKWIPVTERMPTDDDADQNGAIIANHYLFGVRVVCLDNIEKRPAHYTHWMPLPEPPKGE